MAKKSRGSSSFSVRFPEPLFSEFNKFVADTNSDFSTVIRQAVKEYIAKAGKGQKNSR